MTRSESDSALPTGEPASAGRSLGQVPWGNSNPRIRQQCRNKVQWPAITRRDKGEREKNAVIGVAGGWERKVPKRRHDKQGDPCGTKGCDRGERPGHRRTGVRAFVVARKRGNARGAKGRRKVEA